MSNFGRVWCYMAWGKSIFIFFRNVGKVEILWGSARRSRHVTVDVVLAVVGAMVGLVLGGRGIKTPAISISAQLTALATTPLVPVIHSL